MVRKEALTRPLRISSVLMSYWSTEKHNQGWTNDLCRPLVINRGNNSGYFYLSLATIFGRHVSICSKGKNDGQDAKCYRSKRSIFEKRPRYSAICRCYRSENPDQVHLLFLPYVGL